MFFRSMIVVVLQFFLVFGEAYSLESRDNRQSVILVTGGTGYIGSHVSVALLNAGYKIVIADNLSNSKQVSIDHIEKITNKKITKFYKVDMMTDYDGLNKVFSDYHIAAVIHMAGLKSLTQSVSDPIFYYRNNPIATLNLLRAMKDADVRNLIFSSSASVYGIPQYLPIDEKHPVNPTNPYGRTKLMAEEFMHDLSIAWKEANFIALRYFNPMGNHESGELGEDPRGIPNNLVPYILQVLSKRLEILTVTGNDWPTRDGTGVRDFIHVMDLAEGHLAALKHLEQKQVGFRIYNLGTGTGYSVLEILKEFENAGKKVPYKFGPRRPGDVASVFANPKRANKELQWKANRDMKEMVRDSLKWTEKYPYGFQ